MNFFSKLKFLCSRPKIIIVTGENKGLSAEAIYEALKLYFKVEKLNDFLRFNSISKSKILIFETDLEDLRKFKFLVKYSKLPIMVVTAMGQIPFDRIFFAGPALKVKAAMELAKSFPLSGSLILNFDDETVRDIKSESKVSSLTFGFQEKADLKVTDINLNRGTNFKADYRGNIVPIWLEGLFGKENIYSALSSVGTGVALGLNLVEVSQGLKFYSGLPGKMRLIRGIKNSWILDHTFSSYPLSTIEALDTLSKVKVKGRRIAALGDILEIGKYALGAHQTIGEKAGRSADLLFTFGSRAKFIAKGAFEKGLEREKIFQFDTIEQGKLELQNQIKEEDLILVDGSKEMEMEKIIAEIRE